MMPLRYTNEPYLRYFQYKVLNSIFIQMNYLVKIKYNRPATFQIKTVLSTDLIFFYCSFAIPFWREVYDQILSKLTSCESVTPEC